jgi:MFS family permease
MSAVYGAAAGLSVAEISIFVGTFYIGAMVLQYPLGFMSDRMDRRLLIMAVAGSGAAASMLGMMLGGVYTNLLISAFFIGGLVNPLYSLLIAYTNDYLDHDDMAAASGGLVFINGLGAIAGPLITGWMMGDAVFGPPGFFLFMAALLAVLAVYALYRMTQRAAVPVEDTGTFATVYPTASPVAVEFAQEVTIEAEIEAEQEEQEAAAG